MVAYFKNLRHRRKTRRFIHHDGLRKSNFWPQEEKEWEHHYGLSDTAHP